MQELTVEEIKNSTFHRFFLSETGWSCTTPMRSIGQSCAVSGTLYLFFACLYTSLICKHLSAIFLCYFCLSFSKSLSCSVKRHKNSSHKHSADFHQQKCHHCHYLFLLFCFVKLFLTVSLFSCYCYFILSHISNRSCNKFSSFISLRC